MTVLLTIYGIAIVVMALVIVGIVHRLMGFERISGGPREPMRPIPEWVATRINAEKTHHMVIIADDSCSICHRTVDYLNSVSLDEGPQLSELVTVLADVDSFDSRRIPVMVDPIKHRNLHPGWAPAGLVFSAHGLVESAPVGSRDSIDHAIDRLGILTRLAV